MDNSIDPWSLKNRLLNKYIVAFMPLVHETEGHYGSVVSEKNIYVSNYSTVFNWARPSKCPMLMRTIKRLCVDRDGDDYGVRLFDSEVAARDIIQSHVSIYSWRREERLRLVICEVECLLDEDSLRILTKENYV